MSNVRKIPVSIAVAKMEAEVEKIEVMVEGIRVLLRKIKEENKVQGYQLNIDHYHLLSAVAQLKEVGPSLSQIVKEAEGEK